MNVHVSVICGHTGSVYCLNVLFCRDWSNILFYNVHLELNSLSAICAEIVGKKEVGGVGGKIDMKDTGGIERERGRDQGKQE